MSERLTDAEIATIAVALGVDGADWRTVARVAMEAGEKQKAELAALTQPKLRWFPGEIEAEQSLTAKSQIAGRRYSVGQYSSQWFAFVRMDGKPTEHIEQSSKITKCFAACERAEAEAVAEAEAKP